MSLKDELRNEARSAGRDLAGEAVKRGGSFLLGRFLDWWAERRPSGWLARRRNRAQSKLDAEMHAAVDKYLEELGRKKLTAETPAQRPSAKR